VKNKELVKMKTLIASNLILVILLLVALQHIIELHEDVKAFQASDALSSAEVDRVEARCFNQKK